MTSEDPKVERYSYSLNEMQLLQPDCIYDPPEAISKMPWLFKCCERLNCVFHSHVSPKSSSDSRGSQSKLASHLCASNSSETLDTAVPEKLSVIDDFEKLISDLNIKVTCNQLTSSEKIITPEPVIQREEFVGDNSAPVVESVKNIFHAPQLRETYTPLQRSQLKEFTPVSVLRKLTYVPPQRNSVASDESSSLVAGCRTYFDNPTDNNSYQHQAFSGSDYFNHANWDSRPDYMSSDMDRNSSIRYGPSGATIFSHERKTQHSGVIYQPEDMRKFDLGYQNKPQLPSSVVGRDALSELFRY